MNNLLDTVRQIIADALYVDISEVKREANLMKDLGAESIDFLDIIFRLEKAFSIKLPKGEIEKRAQGGLSAEEFAVNGQIQEKGLAQLRKVMSEINADAIKPGLYLRDLPSLFTVATFERMVSEQLAGSDATADATNPSGDQFVRSATVNQ